MIKQYNQYIYKDGQWLLVGVSDQNNFITYVLQKDGDTITLKGDDDSTSDVVIKEFSDEAKAKLENIAAGAQVNVLEGVKVNGTKLTIDGEKLVDISVPTKLSQLTNDADYVADANYVHTDNNYTTAEKNKLAGIATSADVNIIEQIKVNNSALTPDGNKIVNITVPTKLTDLTNDNNFVTDANYVHTDNNYTTAEKNKLAGLSNYDDTEIKEQIAQAGKIDTIKVNGTAQPVVDKTVSLTIPTVPTNISAFTNDKKYQTEDEVTSLIADAVGEIQTLEYSVVGSLPATGETGVIYLVSNGGANPNIYDEYIYINGNFEKIGTTEIDLSGYLTKTEAGETYAQKAEVIQSDWSQNDSNQLDYVKNRTHYEVDNVVSNVIIPNKECTFTITGIGDAFSEMAYDYTEEELAKINNLQDGPATIKVSINGHNFESAIEISNKTFVSDMIEISTIDPGLYFIIVTDSRVAIGYENAGDNYTINLIIEQNNKEIIKLDKKFLPDEVVFQDDLVQSDWNENDETVLSYVQNRTHYIISDYTTYPTLLIEEQNLEPAVLNGEKQPTAVPTSNSIPSSSYGELFEKYSHLLEVGTNNSRFLPIVIRLFIGDVVIDYEGSINSSFSSSFGTTYSASVGEQITNINITEEYPYIESISFLFGPAPMINFTSVEEVEQYPTITIKEELLIPERATKTIDKDFLPYYQGFNYGEAFNDLANQATGKNSHAEGTNTYAGGDSSHAEGSGTGFKATFTIADTGYLSEEGELWDALEIGERSFMLPIEKGINRWCVGDRIKIIKRSLPQEIVDFEEPLVITDVSSHTSWEEKEYSYITCSRQFTEKDLELLNSDLLYALGITSVNYISDTSEAAHLEGKNTKIIGASVFYNAEGSHVEGIGTIATREGQHVQGQYNIPDSSVNTSYYYLHIIGNGDSDTERSNAHTVDSNGNAWYSGKVTAGADPVNAMDLVTKQYLENNSSNGGVYFKGAFATDDTEINNSENILNENDANYETELQEVLATPGNVMFHVVDKSLNNIPE